MKPTNNDRVTACRLLRQLRQQRGWSWADQARALRAVAEQLGVTSSVSAHLSSLQRSIARETRCSAASSAPTSRSRACAPAVRSATMLLHDSVDTTAATGGRVAALRIGRARRELAPWRTESFVVELDDHIYDSFLAK